MRLRLTITAKLLLGFAAPTLALFIGFAWLTLGVVRRNLDDELGLRLTAIAKASATQLRGKYLLELTADQPQARAYLNAVQKLATFEGATNAKLVVVNREGTIFADGKGNALGSLYAQALVDRRELGLVLDQGLALASLSYRGRDGELYKSGYAPIYHDETTPTPVMIMVASAPASYFTAIAALRRRLVVSGGVLMLVVLAAVGLMTFLQTRAVRALAAAADRMKHGDLTAAVAVTSRDELGTLAAGLDEMRRALLARATEREAMLAGIAHEVRNPLAGMTLYVDILRDELPPDDERRSYVDKIGRELGYLQRIVTEFLEYARRPPLERSEVAIADLLAEVASLAQTPEVAVEVEADPALCAVVDRLQLRRAVLNLTQNAVAATTPNVEGKRPPVTLRAAQAAASLVIEVSNHGAPIDPKLHDKLFQPFFTTKEKGTGLGLAFVREIALAHGGTVALRETPPTTFCLTVPHVRN